MSYRLKLIFCGVIAALLNAGCSAKPLGPVTCDVLLSGGRVYVHAGTGIAVVRINKPEEEEIIQRRYQFEYETAPDNVWPKLENVRHSASMFPFDSSDICMLRPRIDSFNDVTPKQLSKLDYKNVPPGFHGRVARFINGDWWILACDGEVGQPLITRPFSPVRWILVNSDGRRIEMSEKTDLMLLEWEPQERRIVFAGTMMKKPPSVRLAWRGHEGANPLLLLLWNYDTNTASTFAFDLKKDLALSSN